MNRTIVKDFHSSHRNLRSLSGSKMANSLPNGGWISYFSYSNECFFFSRKIHNMLFGLFNWASDCLILTNWKFHCCLLLKKPFSDFSFIWHVNNKNRKCNFFLYVSLNNAKIAIQSLKGKPTSSLIDLCNFFFWRIILFDLMIQEFVYTKIWCVCSSHAISMVW